MSSHFTPDEVKAALLQPDKDVPTVTHRMLRRDEQGRPIPRPGPPAAGPEPRQAAVLVPFFQHPYGGRDDALWLLFTRRTDHLPKHRGQISFPGGSVEEIDESYLATALREFEEELGVRAGLVTVWGSLKPVYVPPSHFMIHPFVGFLPYRPQWRPQPAEVAGLIEAPLAELLAPGCFGYRFREKEGRRFYEPGFDYRGNWIWGATAIILDQLLAHLEPA